MSNKKYLENMQNKCKPNLLVHTPCKLGVLDTPAS